MGLTGGALAATLASGPLLLGLLAACGDAPRAAVATPAPAGPAADLPRVANEAEALGLLATLEENELALATQALSRPLDRRTADFAGAMRDEHALALAALHRHPLQDSVQARRLQARGQATNASVALEDEPAGYRQAFLVTAAADYADALALVDASLLPVVRDPATRRYLAATRERLALRQVSAATLASRR